MIDVLMETLSETVGKNLATLRKAKGLTQQDLAAQVHYSDKSISKWELGYSLPSVDILKDFADFYGVTVDYLLKEQSSGDLEKIAKADEAEEKRSKINHAIIIAMTATFVIMVAICVFFSEYYTPFRSSLPSEEQRQGLWIIFVWMVPVTLLLVGFECWHYYHNRITNVVLFSCFAWTLLISFCIQFGYFNDRPEPIWYILTVGVPIQVILILLGNFHRKKV